jgi:hypothetical protein
MSNSTSLSCIDTYATTQATIFTITTGLSTVLFLLSEILASARKIEANSVFQLLYQVVMKKPYAKPEEENIDKSSLIA